MSHDKGAALAGTEANVDRDEIAKFEALAEHWWDPAGDFKPLHDINPLRLSYIDRHAPVRDQRLVDIGCGGGLLCEGLVARGAAVTGVDMAATALSVARLHAANEGVAVDYRQATAEALAATEAGQYDIVTCLEMLEHVPDPSTVVAACARLLKPGGRVFFSTINRNPKAYLFAIIGAEYVLRLLPRGTHDYQKFIRPSELADFARDAGLALLDTTGMHYNPLTRVYTLGDDVAVNYLMHFERPGPAT